MSRIHSLPRRRPEVVLALKISFQEREGGLTVYNPVNIVLWGFQNWKLSTLKHCTCDSLLQEQRLPSYFSLNAEVNNETKYPFEICIYHLQEALPNNQWQLGWQANFRVQPQGIQVYFRFTVDSKGQRKNKLSKQCHATTNLCWPSRN